MTTSLHKPGPELIASNALDITAPQHEVSIEIRNDGTVIWINVDGICALRICRIPALKIEDGRERC